MLKTKLPLGVQSFRKFREQGLPYVDKTGFAARLIAEGDWYFLSRPRRFGKSLFIDMLQLLFEGNESLFRGLAIHQEWDWSVRNPVIRFNFGGGHYGQDGDLEVKLSDMLARVERETGLPQESAAVASRFGDLIRGLRKDTGRPVVVLVDEYDKPLLSTLDNSEVARRNRDVLQGFYSTLKDEDDDIRFCFVTGVTRFSRVSLFSGANNLRDISLEPEYSTICGYTESDLDEVFAEQLAGMDRDKIRYWYNGYCWRGSERVYSPYSILLLLAKQEYKAWWYETSTPTFLVDELMKRGVLPLELEDMTMSDEGLTASDVDKVSSEALLFQTGYLTITEESGQGSQMSYTLDYPNREVRESLNRSLLPSFLSNLPERKVDKYKGELVEIMSSGNIEDLESLLESVFAGIPFQWHVGSQATEYEDYFISVVYGFFLGAGVDIRVEDSTSEGRIDLAVVDFDRICLFEFKVINGRSEGSALKQLRSKRYDVKYRSYGKPIHLIGVEFSKKARNVALFETELA